MSEQEQRHRTETASVLIIEDETEYAEVYAHILDEYDVQIATSGNEGVELLDESVDVVLLDRRLPDMDGEEVLETIRQKDLDCRTVIVSAVEPDFDIVGMSIDSYLAKPIDNDELHDTVERLLDQSETESDRQRFNSLLEKQAALKANKSYQELQQSEEYARLEEEIQSLRIDLGIVHSMTLLKLGLFLVWWFSGIGVGTAFMEPDVIGAQISAEIFLGVVLAHFCSLLLIVSLIPGPSDRMDLSVITQSNES